MGARIRLPRGEWFYDPAKPLGPAGGFGQVFEGHDAAKQKVAVKRLKLSVGDAAHRELKIADELAGKVFQHVLAVLDSGEDSEGSGYFVVMPRAERSLADELKSRGMLPVAEAVDILGQIATGLKELAILVHRDLKPANILLHDGKWKIADLGIARFVEEATSINTVRDFLSAPYAAPEQWAGERATHATDVYALSCIAYVLLTGAPPFPGPSQTEFFQQHTSQAPPPLTNVDSRLRAIFTAGLRKPQGGRPQVDRVIGVLREFSMNPVVVPAAFAALQAANAAEAERASAIAAAAERERQKAAERMAMVDAGEDVLLNIIARWKEVLHQHATEASIRVAHPGRLQVAFGGAEFEIAVQGGTPPNVSFSNSKWDVLAIGQVEVRQTKPYPWNIGATLWYMQLQVFADYRWYEVAYKYHPLFYRGPLVGPFPIQNVGDAIYAHADLAAGPGMHEIEVESGPTAVDDENESSFVERWLTRFVQAYEGRLRPF